LGMKIAIISGALALFTFACTAPVDTKPDAFTHQTMHVTGALGTWTLGCPANARLGYAECTAKGGDIVEDHEQGAEWRCAVKPHDTKAGADLTISTLCVYP
jgi:hypothetical protein